MFHLVNFHVPCCRFKDHVQSNHPKHFLSEEEFVKLRVELSKSSLAGMISEDDAAVAQEELPPGTEDLADPAKVKLNDRFCRGGGHVLFNVLLVGVSRKLPVRCGNKSVGQVWSGVFMSAAEPMIVGGTRVGIRSGSRPKSHGSDRGQLPQNRHTEAKMQGAYVPPASSGFLFLAN